MQASFTPMPGSSLTVGKELREEMENEVWERGGSVTCQEMFQMPLLLPYLKSAMRQEQEREQTLFSGKGQLGLALVCVRAVRAVDLCGPANLVTAPAPSAGSPSYSSR